jgi:hypothetical protein
LYEYAEKSNKTLIKYCNFKKVHGIEDVLWEFIEPYFPFNKKNGIHA